MSFDEITRLTQEINTLARSLTGRPAFDDVHSLIPNPHSPEVAFIKATSWLYCLYFEAGRTSLVFLQRLGEVYSLENRSESDHHIEVVRCLRTELHHNLGFADTDLTTRQRAEMWRKKTCGTVLPNNEHHWRCCYDRIVLEAQEFLRRLDAVIRRLESDGEDARDYIDEWIRRLERNWPAARFDPLISDAKERLGRHALDTVKFRNRHLDKWKKMLDQLEDGFDFEYEATRVIEKTLIDDDSISLPITGKDVEEELGVPRGPRIAHYLEKAREICKAAPCNREELIIKLRQI